MKKMIENCDCVRTELLKRVFSDMGEQLVSEIKDARDHESLEYANNKLDGVVEVLSELRKYQCGQHYLFEDEDFSSLDIDLIVHKISEERTEAYYTRKRIIEDVEYYGGWKWYNIAMSERAKKEQEASK